MPVIETSLGRIAEPDGDRVEFIVRTDVPAYQARLPKMGWQPGGGPGSFTRRLDNRCLDNRRIEFYRAQRDRGMGGDS